jgi:hypothetical protein
MITLDTQHIGSVVMLSVTMLSVIIQNVIVLNVGTSLGPLQNTTDHILRIFVCVLVTFILFLGTFLFSVTYI